MRRLTPAEEKRLSDSTLPSAVVLDSGPVALFEFAGSLQSCWLARIALCERGDGNGVVVRPGRAVLWQLALSGVEAVEGPGPSEDYAPLILVLTQKGVRDHSSSAKKLFPKALSRKRQTS